LVSLPVMEDLGFQIVPCDLADRVLVAAVEIQLLGLELMVIGN
jgi:hypothetical protein